jgi:hypothetical protein
MRRLAQSTLAAWWGVHDRRELLERLDRLSKKGHSERFLELAERYADPVLAASAFEQALRSYDATALHRMELVKEYREAVGDRALAAWDYSRYVSLCRWGYRSGYWSEEEAWAHILNAARHIQSLLSPWEAFADNYYVGFRFYSVKAWLENKGVRYLYLQQLLRDADSPCASLES